MRQTTLFDGDPAPAPAPDLAALARDINAEHDACLGKIAEGLAHAIQAGKLLLDAKAQVPHGEWSSWVEGNCRFGLRMAQKYMLAAKNESRFAFGPARPASLRQALAMLAAPDDAHERVEDSKEPPTVPWWEWSVPWCVLRGYGKPVEVEIGRIDPRPASEGRVEHPEDVVDRYAAAFHQMPPLAIVLDADGTHWLADGYFRYLAARKLGKTTVICRIKPGTHIDAFGELTVNDLHGMAYAEAKAVARDLFGWPYTARPDHAAERTALVECERRIKDAGQRLAEAGRSALEVKQLLGPERFAEWLRAKFGEDREAQVLAAMQLVEKGVSDPGRYLAAMIEGVSD